MYKIILLTLLFIIPYSFVVSQTKVSQPKVLALPKPTGGKDSFSMLSDKIYESAQNVIQRQLAERHLEAGVLDDIKRSFDEYRMANPELSGDVNAILAANYGADVYVAYSCEIIRDGGGQKGKILMEIYETGTGKLLASNPASSKSISTNDVGSLIEMAADNAMPRLFEQVRGYWIQVKDNGKPIKVSIIWTSGNLNESIQGPLSIADVVTKTIKANSKSMRKDMATPHMLVFKPVYIDYLLYDDLTDYKVLIAETLNKLGFDYNEIVMSNSTGYLLDFKITR